MLNIFGILIHFQTNNETIDISEEAETDDLSLKITTFKYSLP